MYVCVSASAAQSWFASLISAWPYTSWPCTFLGINHEIFSHSPHFADLRRAVGILKHFFRNTIRVSISLDQDNGDELGKDDQKVGNSY